MILSNIHIFTLTLPYKLHLAKNFPYTNQCFTLQIYVFSQIESACVLGLNTLGFEKSFKKKYLHYETKALTNRPNITYFVGKETCMPQYTKLNPDAYPVITKLTFEENLL